MSAALVQWRAGSWDALDEIESAHTLVGGSGPGRRFATQQINQAYAVLLSSQFQRFCRDLHTECADILTGDPAHAPLNSILRARLTEGRRLDMGNPNPGNIGSDFNRFGLKFWDRVHGTGRHNLRRRARLEELNGWRNAIAHQDFGAVSGTLRLAMIRDWRRACDGLAVAFDQVMRVYLASITGTAPW